jgi:hypothetical protein
MCALGNKVGPHSALTEFRIATTQNAGTIAPAGEALFRDPRERADRDHAIGRGGLILADAYAAEIFAQGEPDGVRCRAMLVRFAHAAAHRLHRLSGREVVAQRLTHFM